MNKIKKGDKVKVSLGKDHGKTGVVERVIIKKEKIIIQGVNVYKRHIKKQGETAGGTLDLTKPINISNVVLVCPNCNKTTRVGFKKIGKLNLRMCKKCGKGIDKNNE